MLGIDVAKDTLACTLLDPRTRKALWRRSIPNTPSGISALLSSTPADAPWVLEPTGRYSTPVAALARQADRSVLLAPPRQAKSFLRSIQCRAKHQSQDRPPGQRGAGSVRPVADPGPVPAQDADAGTDRPTSPGPQRDGPRRRQPRPADQGTPARQGAAPEGPGRDEGAA